MLAKSEGDERAIRDARLNMIREGQAQTQAEGGSE